MNLIYRILLTFMLARFQRTQSLQDVSKISFRVLPTDADFLWHLNNGRYFSLLDLARIKYLIISGLLKKIKPLHIYPVVASEMIRFKKSINLFKRFTISTKLVGWDDKFFYIQHVFTCGNEVMSMAGIKVCYIKKGAGLVSTNEILPALQLPTQGPQLPDWIAAWQEADQGLYNQSINQSA